MNENSIAQYIVVDFDKLDFKNDSKSIQYKESDVKSTRVNIKCLFKGEPIDLTGMSFLIRLQSGMNTVEDIISEVDLNTSTISYVLPSNALVSGINHFEVVMTRDGNWVKTSPKIYYRVYNSIMDGGVESDDRYPIIIGLLGDLRKALDDSTALNKTISDAESIRVTNENARLSAESTRVANENNRIHAESTRVSNENTRISNESKRVSAENTRVSNENIRIDNENKRISAESTRVSNENTRISNENTRVSNENTRISNESKRVSAENTRVTNENTRITNESDRIGIFSVLETDTITVINNANNKVIDCEDRMTTIEDEFDKLKLGTGFATITYVNEILSEFSESMYKYKAQYNINSSALTLDDTLYSCIIKHNLNVHCFLEFSVRNSNGEPLLYSYDIIDANTIKVTVCSRENISVVLQYTTCTKCDFEEIVFGYNMRLEDGLYVANVIHNLNIEDFLEVSVMNLTNEKIRPIYDIVNANELKLYFYFDRIPESVIVKLNI